MEADVSSHANLVRFFALHSPTSWDGASLFLEVSEDQESDKGQRSVFRPGVSVWKMTTTSNGTELTKITTQNKINSLTTDEQEIIEDELPDINVNIS